MDYSYLDALFDSVFVLNEDKGVVYCNEMAATLCESSVKRLSKGKPIHEVLQFKNDQLFLMPKGELGKNEPFPMSELEFQLVKSGKDGKGQLAIHPFEEPDGSKRWICIIRDVSLEEVLQKKYHAQLEQKQVVIDQLQDAQAQLEAYSKNLEQMVEERTLEVKQANSMLRAIMNSLGQGFLVFDKEGDCGKIYTKACEIVLEKKPEGQKIWDVLGLVDDEVNTFKMWMTAVFGKKLPFDSLKDLAPNEYKHSKGKTIKLDYFPIAEDSGDLSCLVLVATDFTAEHEANVALDKERKYVQMVLKLVGNKSQFKKFVEACGRELEALIHEVNSLGNKTFDHESAYRLLHTIEGEAATYSVEVLRQAVRIPQEALEPIRKNGSKFIDVKEKFVDGVKQAVSARNSYLVQNEALLKSLGVLGKAAREISEETIQQCLSYMHRQGVPVDTIGFIENLILSQPLYTLFSHYNDMVKVVSDQLGKKTKPIEWIGFDKPVRSERYQDLSSTFVHVFKNIVDHGIECPEDREMMGKPPEGSIQASYEEYQDKSGIWGRIVIKDDGQGIHPETIRKKLNELGQIDKSQLSDDEVIQCIFDSGFSTRSEVSEFSGRGIGMNAVKDEAIALGGRAYIESSPGQWTKLVVEFPKVHKDLSLRKTA